MGLNYSTSWGPLQPESFIGSVILGLNKSRLTWKSVFLLLSSHLMYDKQLTRILHCRKIIISSTFPVKSMHHDSCITMLWILKFSCIQATKKANIQYRLYFPYSSHNIIRYCPKGSQKRVVLFLLTWVEEVFFVFPLTFLCRTLFIQSSKIYHVGPFYQLFVHERTFLLILLQI